jgi:putative isomerase
MMETLRNRIDLVNIPFTDRGSRLMLFRHEHQFLIRLAERWVKWESEVGHYRQRPPILDRLTFMTGEGTPLTDISLETYPHVAHIQTALGAFGWVFIDIDTLLLRLPAGYYGLEFTVYGEHAHTDLRGGTLHGKRNIAYTTNARLVENTIEDIGGNQFCIHLKLRVDPGDALLLNITPRKAYNRSIPDPDRAISHAEATWAAWFDAAPPVHSKYRAHYDYAWWIMRAGLISTRYYFTREALLPSKIHYVGVWHWDQVFHALAYRHVDTKLAEDQLRIILDHQREDGMLPDAIHDEGMVDRLLRPVEADVTKPPIMSWGALKLFKTSHHRDFLEEIYEPLSRWNHWWMEHSRNENGLCEYRHPFSSGLDDNPLWDVGMPVVAPDLNTYLVIQCDSLAQIARLIGDDEDAQHYSHMSQTLLKDMITHMWDEEAGVFRALHNGKPIETLTPFNLMPLLTGKLPQAINERLIENLFNPALFWTPYPLATVSVSDKDFDPMQMWRGPVWININYFFIDALHRNGRHDLAGQLRRKTLDLIMKHKDIYEYYHPMTGERPPKSAPMFGWSAALFIELAIEETRVMFETGEISRVNL